ncbi:MAG TPA: hypothetical protein VGC97_02055 [Pyrinomonadaceae bacterium]|jgi:hypothetical protein
MAYKNNERGKSPLKNNILFLLFVGALTLLFAASGARAQTPASSPAPSGSTTSEPLILFGGYNVTSSVELGVRGTSIRGDENKYRSDFNYGNGFRLFDSSFLLENKDSKSRAIDSLLVTTSGWNADPSGYTRISAERDGFYRFDSNIRQVTYFNNLDNHARNGHIADFKHNFGDFDLTLYPNSDKFRLRLGMGYNDSEGTGSTTSRAYSDEFSTPSRINSHATDLRAGVDTTLWGFNLSLSGGWRDFNDKTTYGFNVPNPGYNTTNTTVLFNFERQHPIEGNTGYGIFNVQRTFAKRLDFTARVSFAQTNRTFQFSELITGRDNSNNIVDSDRFFIQGESRRPEFRTDLGVTYAVTKNFRVSETFTYNIFHIDGGNAFNEALFTRTAAGGARAPVFTNTNYYRVTGFERYANLVEGDYQFGDRFGFHIGWRWTRRRVDMNGFNQSLPPATSTATGLGFEEVENQTNAFIGGFKAKPVRNWVIFGDMEYGDSDNAFTRLANYKVANFRIRSRLSVKQFVFSVSALSKDNENPSATIPNPPSGYPTGEFIAHTKNRMFSAFVDWTPNGKYSVSGGYTFQHLTSGSDIVINTGSLVRGFSQYFMRDHYAFFNFTAQPFKRFTFYAGYNHNKDDGQGDRISVLPNLITSYPFKLQIAESRLAYRFTRNIEWHVGYQYIGYNEALQPLSTTGSPQNYHAHLPYTSVRIYFGGGER